jgi:hypothetical protein
MGFWAEGSGSGSDRMNASEAEQERVRRERAAQAEREAYYASQGDRFRHKSDTSEGREIYGAQANRDYGRQTQTLGELGNSYDIARRAAAGQDVNAQAAEARARQQQADQMRTNYALAASVPMARRAAMQRSAGNQTGASQAALNNSIMNSNAAFQGASRDRMGDINDARMRAAIEARGQSMGADEFKAQLNEGRNQFYEGQGLDLEEANLEGADRNKEREDAYSRNRQDRNEREDAATLGAVGAGAGLVLGAAVGGPAGAAAGSSIGGSLGGAAPRQRGGASTGGTWSDPKLKKDMKELSDRHFAKMAMRGR